MLRFSRLHDSLSTQQQLWVSQTPIHSVCVCVCVCVVCGFLTVCVSVTAALYSPSNLDHPDPLDQYWRANVPEPITATYSIRTWQDMQANSPLCLAAYTGNTILRKTSKCVCVCMRVCTSEYVRACMHVCVRGVRLCISEYVCVFMCVCVRARVCLCVCVHACVH